MREFRLLWAAVVCLMFGYGVYSAVYYNFATESLNIRPEQLGVVESFRELPGLLCVFVAAITMRIAEPTLGSISMILMAIGISASAAVHRVPTLIVWSFTWSMGLHMWMPLSSSITLNLADDKNKGKRLGQTLAAGSLGSVLGMVIVLAVGNHLLYSTWFLIGGATIIIASLILSKLRRDVGHTEKPALVYKRKYSLYYILTFLEGCRKQVFMTFAIYALTRVYSTPLRTVALLMVINSIVNFFGGPIVGRAIDKIGEKRILVTSYSCLILVFLGYATIKTVHWLYLLYCLDNFFYLSTNCLTTYLQKIASPEDLMPTLSMGVTFNHVAAVAVPLVGGLLWARFGYPVTFFGGMFVVAISLFMARKVSAAGGKF